jgi:hypothetical protein
LSQAALSQAPWPNVGGVHTAAGFAWGFSVGSTANAAQTANSKTIKIGIDRRMVPFSVLCV